MPMSKITLAARVSRKARANNVDKMGLDMKSSKPVPRPPFDTYVFNTWYPPEDEGLPE